MSETETFDVVVVGSGSAGAMAALRAAELGFKVIILEKAHKYGGTSATSGGVMWIPNHHVADNDDSREQTLQYLDSIITGPIQRDRLESFLDNGPEMVKFMQSVGLNVTQAYWPDYFADAPGARTDRSLVCPTFDGRLLGEKFPLMREQYTRFKLLNRYAMDLSEFFAISMQAKGWVKAFLKILWRYWTDFGTRRITTKDRRLTSGAALMGQIYKKIFDRGVEVRLETKMDELIVTDGRVSGVKVTRFGKPYEIGARHGVILCAGGFEWNQELRDRFYEVPGLTRFSSSPEDGNRGETLIAGMNIGAATEHTEAGWWIPTMHKPMPGVSNFEEIHQAAFDVGRPHSVCVNRAGVRFVDEACGYDDFGKAMVADHLKTGDNCPCWLVFDADFRSKFTAGGYLPTLIMPDFLIPIDQWDHYIFKANTIEALATKIGVPVDTLRRTVANMNQYAVSGVDPEFGRGRNAYDQMFGDPAVKPNPCLGTIQKAPFYAVPINIGDLGTKGGLKCDANARVVDSEGRPIPNLYAAGNQTGSPFGNCYPGAGATIGPAMTFGFIAANHIAERTRNQPPAGRRGRKAAAPAERQVH